MAKLHSQLTGDDLHSPKGFSVETGSVALYLSQSTSYLTSSVNIVPSDNSKTLGTALNPWGEVFVSTGSVVFVDQSTQQILQTIKATDGGFDFGSAAITASVVVNESGGVSVPVGTVSSSTQIDELGFLQVDGESVVSSSNQILLSSISGSVFPNRELFFLSQVDIADNLIVGGDLQVQGTTTTVDSTTVQIGDNIIELNGTGAANGGLLIKDSTNPNQVSGSLLWDSTNDYWIGGALGSESKFLRENGDFVVTSSAQINVNGDLSGTADSATVTKVQGVTLTSDEATQISNIDSVTISNTQWSYLGGLNQDLASTDDVEFAGVSGSSLDITGNAKIDGDLTLGGNITIGNESSDTISFGGEVSSDIIPSADNTYKLGSVTERFDEVHAVSFFGSLDATNGILSGSTQIATEISGAFAEVSSSLSTDLINISSSIVTDVNTLQSDLNTVSSSILADLSSVSSSLSTDINDVNSDLTTVSSSLKSEINTNADDISSLNNKTLVSSSAQVIYNDISNNPFTNNNGVLSASLSIIPTSADLDLGSETKPFRDVYVSSGSLYVNGQQVISTTGTELRITTDVGESIKLLETGNDTITLETSDGDIVLTSNGTGNVEVDAPMQIAAGKKILSSDGNAIQFGDTIGVTGSIELTGNVDGVDISGFKSSFDTLEGKTLVSSSDQVDVTSTTNYSSVVQTTGNQSIGGVKTFTANNIFNGEQTFNDIIVNGTGSFAVLESVTGSAKIIGDAFIVLNNNTPSERYAGISVYDSGSAGVSASFQFDGESNDWFYEYSDDGGSTNEYGVTLFGPEYNTKGSPTYLTSGSIPKGDGGHHLYDSNISDNGTLITLGSNTSVTGTLVATGTTLISSSAQIATDVSGAFTAGTGLDLASGEFSVDVSDFMTNGVDNRVLTATGTDAMNAESGLTYNGSTLAVTGNITATGEITAFASDDRLKNRIGLIEGAVEKLSHLNGFYYEWNDTAKSLGLNDEERKVGLSAQEMNEALPEVVRNSTVGEDYLTIQYDKVVALLVEGMKEQQEHINQLTARIDELENRGE